MTAGNTGSLDRGARFSSLIPDQRLARFDSYQLESGVVLRDVAIAYKTWGKLNAEGTNVLIICHALSGSADVEDWWGPLLGPGKAFDTTIFFVFCANVLGSPYGSSSPVTVNPETGRLYGPEFPVATIRDDVRLHKQVLDQLGVKQVQFAIGGSMGGMQVLEWSFYGPDWGETQRQAIYTDVNYNDGYYSDDKPPNNGLAAARMQALLTYRSRNSFQNRFGRNVMLPKIDSHTPANPQRTWSQEVLQHNEGHKLRLNEAKGIAAAAAAAPVDGTIPAATANGDANKRPSVYSAQSYLRYQGDKFVKRFDANCYIAITRKMDSHDISRGRGDYLEVLGSIPQPCLVIGIQTDGLFTIDEQQELAEYIPKAHLEEIESGEGHDGFLLEFDQVNRHITTFMRQNAPEIFINVRGEEPPAESFAITKNSVFGEAEDVMRW
ncbi:homoserine O- acetyltransferase [Rhizophlyctis rosea]|uniref:Homoserine O- acetyltransferase n=1 Tax=Rhizophlyctis rosea TaxID=64517 RepID=A0AAD5X9S7_9FUNG|nr:homoserine O- acetyltransferase [Rhizophlyctis rosea]